MTENYTHQNHPTYKRNVLAMTLLSTIFFGWAFLTIESLLYLFLTTLLVGAGAVLFLRKYFLRKCPNCQRTLEPCNTDAEIQLRCDSCQTIWHTKISPSND